MVRKLEVEYRIRWRQPETKSHRTRYYSRRHHAVRAAAKYRAKGCVVEFDEREMLVTVDWEPSLEVEQAQAVPKVPVVVCRLCEAAIKQPAGFTIWNAGGKRGHICPKSVSHFHVPA